MNAENSHIIVTHADGNVPHNVQYIFYPCFATNLTFVLYFAGSKQQIKVLGEETGYNNVFKLLII